MKTKALISCAVPDQRPLESTFTIGALGPFSSICKMIFAYRLKRCFIGRQDTSSSFDSAIGF